MPLEEAASLQVTEEVLERGGIDRRVPLDDRDEIFLPERWVSDVVVDHHETAARREDVRETRHDHVVVHPVKALSAGDQSVWRIERRALGRPNDPPDVRIVAIAQSSALLDHRRGWIDRVDPARERAQMA